MELLTFNIGNPSVERARRQVEWLAGLSADVFVLTETKASKGCALIAESFRTAGYAVEFPAPDDGGYGTMIISRVRVEAWPWRLDFLPARVASVALDTPGGPVHVLGLYVPSRDASPAKTARKRRWLDICTAALTAHMPERPRTILLGDLNILEPDHVPRYSLFRPFEYDFYRALGDSGLVDAFRHCHPERVEHSWVGRTGDGYRYDHVFVSKVFAGDIIDCAYVHEPRHERLSDHSAMTVHLGVEEAPRLELAPVNVEGDGAPALF